MVDVCVLDYNCSTAWWMFASWITIVQHMSYPGGSLQRHELNSKMQLSVVVHVHIIL